MTAIGQKANLAPSAMTLKQTIPPHQWIHSFYTLVIYLFAGFALLASILFPFFYEYSVPLPEVLPEQPDPTTFAHLQVASDAYLQVVFFLTTIAFGLAGVATVVFWRDHRRSVWRTPLRALLLSSVAFALSNVVTRAFDASVSVVFQLDRGYFFLARLNGVLQDIAIWVVSVGALTFVLATLSFVWDRE